jgi:hypothetical protein
LVVGDEQSDLLRKRALVEEQADTFAGGELSLLMNFRDLIGTAACAKLLLEREVFVSETA